MRRHAAVIVASTALAVFASGCGGDDAAPRSAAVEELAALCTQARLDVEALGLPSEVGVEIVPRWATVGRTLATDVGKLDGATPLERGRLTKLSKHLDEYYAGLKLAYLVYTSTKNAEGYVIAVERATPHLTSAEQLAARMGAPECAQRPHAETPSLD